MAIRRRTPRNLARGGGKTIRAQIEGVKQLELKLRDMVDMFRSSGGTARAALLRRELSQVLWRAGEIIAEKIRVGAPARRIKPRVFTFADPKKDRPRRTSALVGVGKKALIQRDKSFEWIANNHPKSPRAKVPAGRKVAMSIAAMFEQGTTQQRKKPFFAPAVKSMRERALSFLSEHYRRIIRTFDGK